MRYRRNTEETNFWAGYADCMLALFMIALLLWLLGSGITAFALKPDEEGRTPAQLAEEVSDLRGEVARLSKDNKEKGISIVNLKSALLQAETRIKSLESELNALKKTTSNVVAMQDELERLKHEIAKLLKASNTKDIDTLVTEIERLKELVSKKPPIINLTEGVTKEFRFPSGKAVIPVEFLEKLETETFPDLKEILLEFPNIDTLEIVGHTDGSPIQKLGNTDLTIPNLLNGTSNGDDLIPGSNADLGLMRALSIRNEWYKWLDTQHLDARRVSKIDVRCYSAAQTVPPGEVPINKSQWLADIAKARRIEIRVTQLKLLK